MSKNIKPMPVYITLRYKPNWFMRLIGVKPHELKNHYRAVFYLIDNTRYGDIPEGDFKIVNKPHSIQLFHFDGESYWKSSFSKSMIISGDLNGNEESILESKFNPVCYDVVKCEKA